MVELYSADNYFDHNVYRVRKRSAYWTWNDETLTWGQWQALGQDVNGTGKYPARRLAASLARVLASVSRESKGGARPLVVAEGLCLDGVGPVQNATEDPSPHPFDLLSGRHDGRLRGAVRSDHQ